jgi:L-amino acid N-acyltransferase YncA
MWAMGHPHVQTRASLVNVMHRTTRADDNERAIALYERVGFKKEGTMQDAALIDGRYKDVILMAIVDRLIAAPAKPAAQP